MRRIHADLLLLLAAAIWGFAFLFQKSAMGHIGPLLFIAARATVATVAGWGGSSDRGWLGTLLAQPAAWSMPIAFATTVIVSLATPGSVPKNAARILVRLHAPEEVAGRHTDA